MVTIEIIVTACVTHKHEQDTFINGDVLSVTDIVVENGIVDLISNTRLNFLLCAFTFRQSLNPFVLVSARDKLYNRPRSLALVWPQVKNENSESKPIYST